MDKLESVGIAKNCAELRIVIKDGLAYAPIAYMNLRLSGDIYCGTEHRPDLVPKMKLGKESLRTSYHKDGNVFMRTIDELMKLPTLDPLDTASGFRVVTSAGISIYDEHFRSKKPKANSRYRTTRFVERRNLPHSSVTVDWIVLGEDSFAYMPEILQNEYKDRSVLGYAIAYWTTPVIGMIAWTLSAQDWQDFERVHLNKA